MVRIGAFVRPAVVSMFVSSMGIAAHRSESLERRFLPACHIVPCGKLLLFRGVVRTRRHLHRPPSSVVVSHTAKRRDSNANGLIRTEIGVDRA